MQSNQNHVYIKNGEIVNHDETFKADVYIEDGTITFVGPPSDITIRDGVRVIDAAGKLIIPGGVDPHTHFQLKVGGTSTADDFYYGTRSAVAGGTTTIIDCVFPEHGESLVEAYDNWRKWADPMVCCDYALHVGLTWWSKSIASEMKIMCEELGVNSFKLSMANKGQLSDSEILHSLKSIRSLGALALVHSENAATIQKNINQLLATGVKGHKVQELSRPEEVEAQAVHHACELAHQMKAPLYIASITTKASAEIVGRARRSGYCVFGETLASSIGRSMHEVSEHERVYYITCPPIRESPETPSQLMKSLACDALQVTGSDNCTFNREDKAKGLHDFSKILSGINGVEDRMSIVWEKGVHDGYFDPNRFVAVTSTNAAKIFNLYPQKGRIAVGSNADVVIWNPNATRTISKDTHHHNVDYNIFEGMVCHGVAELVLVRGRVCFDRGTVLVAEGYGRFLNPEVRSPYVYDLLEGRKELNDEPLNHVSRTVASAGFMGEHATSCLGHVKDSNDMKGGRKELIDEPSNHVARAGFIGEHATSCLGHVKGSKDMDEGREELNDEPSDHIARAGFMGEHATSCLGHVKGSNDMNKGREELNDEPSNHVARAGFMGEHATSCLGHVKGSNDNDDGREELNDEPSDHIASAGFMGEHAPSCLGHVKDSNDMNGGRKELNDEPSNHVARAGFIGEHATSCLGHVKGSNDMNEGREELNDEPSNHVARAGFMGEHATSCLGHVKGSNDNDDGREELNDEPSDHIASAGFMGEHAPSCLGHVKDSNDMNGGRKELNDEPSDHIARAGFMGEHATSGLGHVKGSNDMDEGRKELNDEPSDHIARAGFMGEHATSGLGHVKGSNDMDEGRKELNDEPSNHVARAGFMGEHARSGLGHVKGSNDMDVGRKELNDEPSNHIVSSAGFMGVHATSGLRHVKGSNDMNESSFLISEM